MSKYMEEEITALKAERDRLRAFVEELADVEHHSPPVPLWISQKARRILEK